LVQEAHWLFDLNCGLETPLLRISIIQALYGAEGMKNILVDQPGTFVVLDAYVLVATLYS
jgi:hypothetical protein